MHHWGNTCAWGLGHLRDRGRLPEECELIVSGPAIRRPPRGVRGVRRHRPPAVGGTWASKWSISTLTKTIPRLAGRQVAGPRPATGNAMALAIAHVGSRKACTTGTMCDARRWALTSGRHTSWAGPTARPRRRNGRKPKPRSGPGKCGLWPGNGAGRRPTWLRGIVGFGGACRCARASNGPGPWSA